jgi:predicted RNase H-like HicB family nuclease
LTKQPNIDKVFIEIMLIYAVEAHPQKDGGYTITVPNLPGCISEGDTLEAALTNIQEAIQGYLLTLAHRRRRIPIEIPRRLKVSVSLQQKNQRSKSNRVAHA